MAHVDEALVPLADVQQLALSGCRPLEPVRVGIDDSLGLVAAEDVSAPENVPPFPNTAMDGYAVRASDTAGAPVVLNVVGVLAAGASADIRVGPGEAIQIMTGAPIPEGATGIAIVERTETVGATGTATTERRVRILDEVTEGVHIRGVGSDISMGSVVLSAGTVLTPAHVGVLASVGAGSLLAYPRPKVGVMSTGDELVELAPDSSARPLAPGQIRDSNRHALLAVLKRDGFEPVDLGIIRDTEEDVTSGIERALAECDALLSTGGVSMGEFDYVKVVMSRLAGAADPPRGAGEPGSDEPRAAGEPGAAGVPRASVHVLSVGIRPAKPVVVGFLGAVTEGGHRSGGDRLVPVFGLPGNPVSSMVSYQVIALPALRTLAGHQPAPPATTNGLAAEDFKRRPDGKLHLLRVNISWRPDGRMEARSAGGQMSHQLGAMAAANGLALIPDGGGVSAGDEIEMIVFGPVHSDR